MESSDELRMERYDGPPRDDVCPICFGEFETPCKTNCGHWFCGRCILLLWSYRGAVRQCKCPICCCWINKLVPEPSLFLQEEEEVMKVLERVKHYNCLYGGGLQGLSLKVKVLLLLTTKMITQAVINPENITFILRCCAVACVYLIYLTIVLSFLASSSAFIAFSADECLCGSDAFGCCGRTTALNIYSKSANWYIFG